jgi:hypothetical protein
MSGPFNSSITFTSPIPNLRNLMVTKTWYRSGNRKGHPWSKPNPYTMNMDRITNRGGVGTPSGDAPNSFSRDVINNRIPQNSINAMTNRALDTFKSKVAGEASAALAETVAQWRQSGNMIADRAIQLLNLAVAVKRRNVREIKRHSGLLLTKRQVKDIRNTSKGFGAIWLELHFGWVPLVTDIYNAIEVLGREPKGKKVRAGARFSDLVVLKSVFTLSRTTSVSPYSVGRALRGSARVTNPNAATLDALGVINPVSLAWDLVPFSFVVDWFVPVGAFLNSFYGIPGFTIEESSYTTLTTAVASVVNELRNNTSSPWFVHTLYGSDSVKMQRVMGLPAFHLTYPTPHRVSMVKAATAISLLLQQLERGR